MISNELISDTIDILQHSNHPPSSSELSYSFLQLGIGSAFQRSEMDADNHGSSAMSSTLFVADVPSTLQEPELVILFKSYEGYRDARLRKDKNNK